MFTVRSSVKNMAAIGANHSQVKERGEEVLSSDVLDVKYSCMFKTPGVYHGRNSSRVRK